MALDVTEELDAIYESLNGIFIQFAVMYPCIVDTANENTDIHHKRRHVLFGTVLMGGSGFM